MIWDNIIGILDHVLLFGQYIMVEKLGIFYIPYLKWGV